MGTKTARRGITSAVRGKGVAGRDEFTREITLRICSSLEKKESLRSPFEYLKEQFPPFAPGQARHQQSPPWSGKQGMKTWQGFSAASFFGKVINVSQDGHIELYEEGRMIYRFG